MDPRGRRSVIDANEEKRQCQRVEHSQQADEETGSFDEEPVRLQEPTEGNQPQPSQQ